MSARGHTPPDHQPVALVTGTRKGLGKCLAERLVERGYAVVGCSREPAGWSLPGYTHITADIGDEQQARQLMRSIQEEHGSLDVTINNAGIAVMNHVLLTPVETVDRILSTNFRETFLVSCESARLIRMPPWVGMPEETVERAVRIVARCIARHPGPKAAEAVARSAAKQATEWPGGLS